jgi:hypothetical protein
VPIASSLPKLRGKIIINLLKAPRNEPFIAKAKIKNQKSKTKNQKPKTDH